MGLKVNVMDAFFKWTMNKFALLASKKEKNEKTVEAKKDDEKAEVVKYNDAEMKKEHITDATKMGETISEEQTKGIDNPEEKKEGDENVEGKIGKNVQPRTDIEILEHELQEGCEDMLRLAEGAASGMMTTDTDNAASDDNEEETKKLTSEMASRIANLRNAKS